MADKSVQSHAVQANVTSGPTTNLVNHYGLSVIDQPVVTSDVPLYTTMLYFNNDDQTPVVGWKLDCKNKRHAQFLAHLETWMWPHHMITAQQIINMLVEAANQDGNCRTASPEPPRRPRYLLVGCQSMGGLRGVSFESHKGGWLHIEYSQASCFDKPYKFWDLPGPAK